jgi:hypothetical protein
MKHMEKSEILSCRGDDLVRWSEAVVNPLAIPESSKTFLVEVGLPRPSDPLWIYRFDDGQQTPARMPENINQVRIGSRPRPVCLDEGNCGVVVMPYLKRDMERFVNSTVEQLGAFLVLLQRLQKEPLYAENERAIASIMEAEMRKTDAAAFQDDTCYWSVVIEEMRYSFLTDEELEALARKY